MRFITALTVILVLPVTVGAQTGSGNSPATGGSESLGNQLLDDLKPSARPTPAAPKSDPNSVSKRTQDSSPRSAPRYDLGEDIGQPSGPLSLVRVRQGMQRAASLLGQPSASRSAGSLNQAASIQDHVVDQLDQLIAELSKQCQGGQRPPGDPPPGPNQPSQAKPGDSQNAAAPGQAAAPDASDRLNNAGAKPANKGDIEELANELWGHLPQRAREQMLQSFSEEFLPKYEREIEEYYRRLSEEQKPEGAHQ